MDDISLQEERERMGLSNNDMALLLGINDPSNYRRIELSRREPTIQQKRAVTVLSFLYDLGKLPGLIKKLHSMRE